MSATPSAFFVDGRPFTSETCMDHDPPAFDARELAAEIVASYVVNNSVRHERLPELIALIYEVLVGLERPLVAKTEADPLVKPVSVRDSIRPDYLISMEDGRPYQSLKRHLSVRGMTPGEYKAKWKLPPDYPMVASGYSSRRSQLAKLFGLGRSRVKAPRPDG